MAALESHTLGLTQGSIESRIAQAKATIAQAENIRVQAEAAGNTSDVIEAIKHRDAAYADIAKLEPALNDLNRMRAQPETTAQPAQPINAHHAEWLTANQKWYSDDSSDPQSMMTRQIAAELTAKGMNSGTRAYWQELSNQLNKLTEPRAAAQAAEKPGRKTPPTGQRGEGQAANGVSREIHLSPGQVQAIKDLGEWDDLERRKHWAKVYAKADRERQQNAAN